jgi:hypothetical protein
MFRTRTRGGSFRSPFCSQFAVFGFFPRLLTDKVKPVTEQIVKMATVKAATPTAVAVAESK